MQINFKIYLQAEGLRFSYFCQLLAVILPIKASPSNGYNLCVKKSEPQTNLAFGLSRCRMQDEGPLAFS